MIFPDVDPDNLASVIAMLNQLYASEIVAAQQYWNHSVAVKGMFSTELERIFEEHAHEEMKHAGMVREEIQHLGGILDNSLTTMARVNPVSGPKDVQSSDMNTVMLKQDLGNEIDAVKAYTEAHGLLSQKYPSTASVMQKILKEEYEHRSELAGLLNVSI